MQVCYLIFPLAVRSLTKCLSTWMSSPEWTVHCYSLAYIAAKQINQFDIWQKIILLNDIQICNDIFFYFLPFSNKTDANTGDLLTSACLFMNMSGKHPSHTYLKVSEAAGPRPRRGSLPPSKVIKLIGMATCHSRKNLITNCKKKCCQTLIWRKYKPAWLRPGEVENKRGKQINIIG